MRNKEIIAHLQRIEEAKDFLEGNCLADLQLKIVDVKRFLERFGSLDSLLKHLQEIERQVYVVKDFLTIDEVADYLQISKSAVYKMTSAKEITVYKPNGKNIFILRDDLKKWIRRNPVLSCDELEQEANLRVFQLGKTRERKGGRP